MIRYMKPADRDEFIKMANEFYCMPAVLHSVPEENFRHTFEMIMEQSPYAAGMVAEQDGKIAGYSLLALTYSNEVGGLVVWIEELFIKPEYRSSGIGKEFFSFIRREFDQKAKRYRLEVTKDNTRAVKLYRALGYEPLEYLQMIADL